MRKKIKTSIVLSSLVLGAVNLYAVDSNDYTNNIDIIKNNGEMAVEFEDVANSEIINNGKISVNHNNEEAYSEAMGIEFIDKSKIINNGKIEANTTGTNSSDAVGIWIDYADNTQIENKNTILVNANGNGSGYFLSEAIGTGNLLDSTIVNSGTIKATRNNKLDKQGIAISSDKISLSINSNSKVTLTNTKDGKIYGNILMNVYNSGSNYGSFKNEGFISLPYNATKKETFTFDDDGTSTTISLQPNFGNLVNSGTIEIGAYKDGQGNIENTQIKTVTATFEKGSKMQVAVVEGSKAFVKGDTLSEVIWAKGNTADKGGIKIDELTLNQTKLADNSATLDFEYKVLNDNRQLDLVVTKVESIKDIVTNPETGNKPSNNINVNAGNIASILDEMRNNQDKYPTMGSVISKIDSLSSNQDVKNAVNSLLAMTSTSLINTSSSINSSISGIVSNRLGNIKSGLNSGDEIVVDNNKLWAKAYGSLGKQDDKDGISGFDLKTYGLGLGYDKEYKDGQVFGLGGFYTNANVETNGINQENDVDAYSIVAYGSNVLKDDKTTIYYQTSYSLQKNDSKRDLFTGDRANAKFTSKTFAIESKVGHKIALGEKASIEPSVGVSYKHFKNPDYTENGAGALNLKSEKFSNTELLGKIGVDFDYNLTNSSKLTANLGAGYDFHSGKNSVTSSFAGASGVTFDSKGIDNGRWKYEAGVGYVIDINNSNNFSLDYNYQGEGSKFRNNVVSVNYNYKF